MNIGLVELHFPKFRERASNRIGNAILRLAIAETLDRLDSMPGSTPPKSVGRPESRRMVGKLPPNRRLEKQEEIAWQRRGGQTPTTIATGF